MAVVSITLLYATWHVWAYQRKNHISAFLFLSFCFHMGWLNRVLALHAQLPFHFHKRTWSTAEILSKTLRSNGAHGRVALFLQENWSHFLRHQMCKRCPTVVVQSYLEPGYFLCYFLAFFSHGPRSMEYHKFTAQPRQKAKEKQDEEFPGRKLRFPSGNETRQRQWDAMGNPMENWRVYILRNSSII